MENLTLKNDLNVFGFQVKTFPEGIKEAFDTLVEMLPDGLDRSYYGLSYMQDDNVLYFATALEQYAGEAERYNCERYLIEKGDYTTQTIHDWMHKTHTIKDIFEEMLKDEIPDVQRPCIEWYVNDDEMICMVKKQPSKKLSLATE